MTTQTKDKVIVGLWIAVAGVCLALIGAWLYQVATRLGTVYNFDYGESWNVWIGNWWGNGGLKHIYYVFGEEPYYQTFYTPIHYIILGVLYKIFDPSLLIGRLVPLVGVFVSTLCAFLIVRKITGNKWYGVLGGLLFLVVPVTRTWAMFNHVDTLGVTFSLLGIYLVVRSGFTRGALWAVIPFLLGIYTKQIFFIAPLSVCLYLAVANRWRLLSWFSGLMVTGGLSLLFLLQWLSGGRLIEAIFDAPTAYAVHWELALNLIGVVIEGYWLYVILAFCAVLLVLVRGKERKEPYVLLVIYFMAASLLALVTCGKVGSWLGYFLDVFAVSALLIPVLVWKISQVKSKELPRAKVFIGKRVFDTSMERKDLLLMIIPVFVLFQLISFPNYGAWTQPPANIEEDYATVISYVEEVSDDVPILSEDCHVLNETGREPIWESSYFCQAYRNKGLDQTILVNRVIAGEFGLIILEWDVNTFWNWPEYLEESLVWMSDEVKVYYNMGYLRSTEKLADAIRENYQLKDQVGKWWVYEPTES